MIHTLIYFNEERDAHCSKFEKQYFYRSLGSIFSNANYRLVTRWVVRLVSKRDKRGQPVQLFAQQLTFPSQQINHVRRACASVIASLWHTDKKFLSMYISLHENHIKGQCRLEINFGKNIEKYIYIINVFIINLAECENYITFIILFLIYIIINTICNCRIYWSCRNKYVFLSVIT